MKIPSHHQQVMPYLILKNGRAFLKFAQNVFAAEILTEHVDENMRLTHAEIRIGNSTIMLGEANEIWSVQTASLFIYVENADETFHNSLKEGAEIVQDICTQDYGRTAGIKDPCGNIWWITSL